MNFNEFINCLAKMFPVAWLWENETCKFEDTIETDSSLFDNMEDASKLCAAYKKMIWTSVAYLLYSLIN